MLVSKIFIKNKKIPIFIALLVLFILFYGIKLNNEIENVDLIIKETSSKIGRENACIFILCREADFIDLSKTINNFEERFNSRYHYDYVIVNEKLFSNQVKEKIRNLTQSIVKFGLIPENEWSYPSFIDMERVKAERYRMRGGKGELESYTMMCRYYSAYFFRHPLVLEYDYYWRLDVGNSGYSCDIPFDPFKFMRLNNKEYGFVMLMPEHFATVRTLWKETLSFIKNNPEVIDPISNSLKVVNNTDRNIYNLCMYYNNFEIASFRLFRSEKYLKYIEHLEKAGGYFYERWGDAPIHTIAVSMFLPKSKIHFFDNIGYYHNEYNCPLNESYRKLNKCSCKPERSFQFHKPCYRTWMDA